MNIQSNFFPLFIYLSLLLFTFISTIHFSFKDKKDLLSQLQYVSRDQLIIIINKTQSYSPSQYSLTLPFLYLQTDEMLFYYCEQTITDGILDNFNTIIKPFNTSNVSQIISLSDWELKVRWVIHSERYLIKKKKQKPKWGSISQYAHYLNSTILNNKLNTLINENNELNEIDLFEKEIMNLVFIEKHIVTYLLLLPHEFLIQLNINLYHYKVKNNYTKMENICQNIKDLYYYQSDDLRSKIVNDIQNDRNLSNINTIKSFLRGVEYLEQEFIYYLKIINQLNNITQIETYAKMTEKYHRTVNQSLKPFQHLNSYISQIPIDDLKTYIYKMLFKYPELSDLNRLDDLSYYHTLTATSVIMTILNKLTYSDLLRWNYNLKKTYLKLQGKFSQKEIDDYNEKIAFENKEILKNNILKLMRSSDVFSNMTTFIHYADPFNENNSYEMKFSSYLEKFPEFVIEKWLRNFEYYHYNRTKIIDYEGGENRYDKRKGIKKILHYLNLHSELLYLPKFLFYIDQEMKPFY